MGKIKIDPYIRKILNEVKECDREIKEIQNMSKKEKEGYKANFLWPIEEGSVEEAGYEFINAKTENYREKWWMILLVRIQGIEKLDETKK